MRSSSFLSQSINQSLYNKGWTWLRQTLFNWNLTLGQAQVFVVS